MAVKILKHQIEQPVENVFPFFSEIEQFVSIHPVIYKCEPLSANEYQLFEQLSLMGFKTRFSYNVIFEKIVPNQQVIMCSNIRKGVHLRLTFDFECNKEKTTQIVETVDFKGPAIIDPLFLKFLAKTHLKMVENLRSTLPSNT